MNLRQLVIELVEEISVNELPIYSSAAIARIEFAIQSAILAEREACAKICDEAFERCREIAKNPVRATACNLVANKIRARSNAPESPNKAPESSENLQSSTFSLHR